MAKASIKNIENALELLNFATGKTEYEQEGHLFIMTSTLGCSVVRRTESHGFEVFFGANKTGVIMECIVAYHRGFLDGKTHEFNNPTRIH